MATQRRTFREDEIEYAWNQAHAVDGLNPDEIRMDYAGALIMRHAYGDRTSSFGWEVDHIIPLEKNGPYNNWNYTALQWENNMSKGDDFPVWKTNRAFNGRRNEEDAEKQWIGIVFNEQVKIVEVRNR